MSSARLQVGITTETVAVVLVGDTAVGVDGERERAIFRNVQRQGVRRDTGGRAADGRLDANRLLADGDILE